MSLHVEDNVNVTHFDVRMICDAGHVEFIDAVMFKSRKEAEETAAELNEEFMSYGIHYIVEECRMTTWHNHLDCVDSDSRYHYRGHMRKAS